MKECFAYRFQSDWNRAEKFEAQVRKWRTFTDPISIQISILSSRGYTHPSNSLSLSLSRLLLISYSNDLCQFPFSFFTLGVAFAEFASITTRAKTAH